MEPADYIKFAAALLFVLALMGGLSLILRRIQGGASGPMIGAKRRLKIIEVLQLDPRRKLALIQRDDKQHLVILGQSGETVIETSITAPDEKQISVVTNDDKDVA